MSIAVKAVADYYEAARQPKYDPKEFRLSETGDCLRKRVLKVLGYQPTHPVSPEGLRTMETGNVWEAWLVERLKSTWPDVETQVTVETPYGAAGHIDAVLRGPFEHGNLIVEVKVVSQWAKHLPEQRHVDQVMAYLHFYGRARGIDQAELVYIHRENGAGPFVHTVRYDPVAGAEIEDQLRALRNYADLEVLPQVPAGMRIGQFPCSWDSRTGGGHCSHFGHCWGTNGSGQS